MISDMLADRDRAVRGGELEMRAVCVRLGRRLLSAARAYVQFVSYLIARVFCPKNQVLSDISYPQRCRVLVGKNIRLL